MSNMGSFPEVNVMNNQNVRYVGSGSRPIVLTIQGDINKFKTTNKRTRSCHQIFGVILIKLVWIE